MSLRSQLLQLLNSLRDKAYRALFVETQIEALIPFQIRAMRARRGWTQKDLAERAGMAQGRISVLESTDYEGAVNIKTLVKLADAFDVGLIVRFAPFSEVADWSTRWSRDRHDVPDFATEIAAIEALEVDDYSGLESVQVATEAGSDRFSLDVHDAAAAA